MGGCDGDEPGVGRGRSVKIFLVVDFVETKYYWARGAMETSQDWGVVAALKFFGGGLC